MIAADLYYDGLTVKGFVVKGHAGMAPRGEDLVCASVSALTQTVLLGLDDCLTKKPDWKLDQSGQIECWLPEGLTPAEAEKAQVIFRMLELGLLSIEKSYGKYLKISKRRWNECCLK